MSQPVLKYRDGKWVLVEPGGSEAPARKQGIETPRIEAGQSADGGADGAARRIEPIALPAKMEPADIDAAPPKVWLVEPASLKVEPAYQRDLSKRSIRLIRKIVTGFDWTKFKLPIVDEGLNIIDGQHTAIAAATHPRIKEIPVLVVPAERIEKRAASFVSHNRDRINMTPAQVFHAEYAAGGEEARAIQAAAEAAGCSIPRNMPLRGKAKPGEITAIAEARACYRKGGAEMLSRILRIAKAAQCVPVAETVIRALRIIFTDDLFGDVAVLPDDEIAAALLTFESFDAEARAHGAETDQSRFWAGALLIANKTKAWRGAA